MTNFKNLFKEAEKLIPPYRIWERIEAQAGLKPGSIRSVQPWWEMPAYRLAASIAVVSSLLGLVFMLQHHGPLRDRPVVEGDVVDSEVLTWDSGLGEWDVASDEESQLADKVFERTESADSKLSIGNEGDAL